MIRLFDNDGSCENGRQRKRDSRQRHKDREGKDGERYSKRSRIEEKEIVILHV